jgi:hypothetical protein
MTSQRRSGRAHRLAHLGLVFLLTLSVFGPTQHKSRADEIPATPVAAPTETPEPVLTVTEGPDISPTAIIEASPLAAPVPLQETPEQSRTDPAPSAHRRANLVDHSN